jgi:hypothetical protein
VVRRLLSESEALPQAAATSAAAQQADPDMDLHLAAESHVSGTFQLLQAVRAHWEQLPTERQAGFRFHHISTDEVFGSLGATGRFSETTPYDPRSPYSASKAASAHQLQQQLWPLAISREADSALWRWAERARLALRGRPRGCATALEAMGSARIKRWWKRSAVRSMTCCPLVPTPHTAAWSRPPLCD